MPNPMNNNIPPMMNNNPAMQQIANVINQAKGMQNPQAFIQQLSAKNPQAAQQIQQLMQSGKNPKDIAMSIMRQRGINPAQIEQMIRGN